MKRDKVLKIIRKIIAKVAWFFEIAVAYFMSEHNREIKQKLQDIRHKVVQASNHQDLYEAVQIAIDHGEELVYVYNERERKIAKFYWFCTFHIVDIIVISLIYFVPISFAFIDLNIFALVFALSMSTFIVLILFLVSRLVFGKKLKKAKQMSYLDHLHPTRKILGDITQKDILLDNGISINQIKASVIKPNLKKSKLWLKSDLDNIRTVKEYACLSQEKIAFTYYQIKSIDGDVRSAKVEYRSGFIFNVDIHTSVLVRPIKRRNPFVYEQIYIKHTYSEEVHTASVDFNHKFDARGRNATTVNRLFPPAVIELFSQANFGEFALEILPNGLLLIQFYEQDFLMRNFDYESVASQYRLHDPRFLAMLKEENKEQHFVQMLSFVKEFMRYTESNFA